MQGFSRLLLILFFSSVVSSAAHATLIVDTGPGGDSTNWSLGTIQSLAGQFSTAQAWSINSIEGWIGGLRGDQDATATIAIYSDTGQQPGIELHAQEFLATGTINAWQGGYGLGWSLPAGTYWAVFDVRPGQTLSGWMSSPVVSPLPSAYSNSLNNYQWLSGDLSIGIRIDASAVSVPVPPTPLLLGLALLVLGRRLRQ